MSKSELVDKDNGWRDFFLRVRELGGDAYVKVGVLGNSSRGSVRPKGSSLTVAEYAMVNEFGSGDGRIPPRPAFRMTYDRMQEELAADARVLIMRVLFGVMEIDDALGVLGAKLGAEIRKTITAGDQVPPPNADSTKRRKQAKGNSRWGVRTLVDVGREVAAISWAIVRRNQEGKAHYVGGGD